MTLNYERDIQIDPHGLEIEWLKQAALRIKYGKALAEANRDRDLGKEKVALVKAGLDLQARTEESIQAQIGKYDSKGKLTVTETAIATWVTLHVDYQEVNEEFHELKYQAEILDNVVKAFDQRRNALENLVSLWKGNYFAGPKEPKELPRGEIAKGTKEKAVKRQRTRLNRK